MPDVPASVKMGLEVAESLPPGSGKEYGSVGNTGVGRAKTVMRRWGYLDDAPSVDCDCGEPQAMAHLLSCRLLDEACTADDLATETERAKTCARPQVGENCVKDMKEEEKIRQIIIFHGNMCVDQHARDLSQRVSSEGLLCLELPDIPGPLLALPIGARLKIVSPEI